MKNKILNLLCGAVVVSFSIGNTTAMKTRQPIEQQAMNSIVAAVTSQQFLENALQAMRMTSGLLQNQQAKQGAQRVMNKLVGLLQDLQNNPQQTSQKILGIMQMVYPLWPDPELKPLEMLLEAQKLLQNPQRNPQAVQNAINAATLLLSELGDKKGVALIIGILGQRQQVTNLLNIIKQAKAEEEARIEALKKPISQSFYDGFKP